MTPAERKALVFLAAVAALGAGTRALRAPRGDARAPEARAALARQIERVDSARRAGRAAKSARVGNGGRRATRRRPDAGGAARREGNIRDSAGPLIVDLDVAGAAEIERLPRIGPALARRVVADRESNGPYGSLGALERVRGIGPALAGAVAPYVTFSGTPRPTSAEPDRAQAAPEAGIDASGNRSGTPRRRALRRPRRGAAGAVSP